ncbi:MAG: recombinase family protein [archaeon]|nr:recombinase family protein [archaeon]
MKAALYIRVSTEEQATEGYSLAAQEEKLLMYCTDIVDDLEVYDIYRDEGFSGRTEKRPEYQRMMSEIDNWDLILVLKMDRIHRNTRNFMMMMDKLVKKKKEFRSATEELDTTTAMGRFVVNMIQNIAQLESEQIGERTKMGMTQKAQSMENNVAENRTMGFNPPFGYDLENRLLVPIREQLAVVTRIYKEYLEGCSLEDLKESLNRDGLRTKNGKQWTKDNLSTILHNPIYAGYLRWDGLVSRHYATPAVNVETFNEVQKKAASRARNPKFRKADLLIENVETEKMDLISVDDFSDI